MCGIAGFWTIAGQDPSALEPMLDQIVHRGPDGRGKAKTGGPVMGHTRLSIIDLATGGQPLTSPCKGLTYTGNAEFYDYKSIRCQMTARGHKFTTKSDNEIALKFYEEHGLDFTKHLRGEFAFALYDEKKDRLVLARDRFGIRPLFYKVEDGAFYYGSEIKSILAHPRVRPRLSKQAAIHQLMQTMVPGQTIFEGIEALKPGHMLIVERKGDALLTRQICYWDATFPTKATRISDDEAITEVRRLMTESIALRLEADVPVACYLSGGIDSCSIFGLASALQQSPVTAFTIGFDSDAFDETSIAREMTKDRKSRHEVIHLGASDLYGQNYRDTLRHSERTFYNTLGVAKFLLSRKVHESGLKVVITGEGADELFAGYPFFKQDLMQLGGHEELLGADFDLYRKGDNKIFDGSMITSQAITHPGFDKLCGFTPNWIQTWIQTLELVKPLFSSELTRESAQYDPLQAIVDSFDASKVAGRHPLNIAQYTWIKTTLEGQLLNWGGDRVDMAHSLETRPAFLDHKLAEFAFSLPPSLLLRNGTEKWVLREAVRGVLPDVLYKRQKFPFMAPPAHYDESKKEALSLLVKEHLNHDAVEELGLLDPGKTSAFIDAYFREQDPSRATRADVVVNHVLGLHMIHQNFVSAH